MPVCLYSITILTMRICLCLYLLPGLICSIGMLSPTKISPLMLKWNENITASSSTTTHLTIFVVCLCSVFASAMLGSYAGVSVHESASSITFCRKLDKRIQKHAHTHEHLCEHVFEKLSFCTPAICFTAIVEARSWSAHDLSDRWPCTQICICIVADNDLV